MRMVATITHWGRWTEEIVKCNDKLCKLLIEALSVPVCVCVCMCVRECVYVYA